MASFLNYLKSLNFFTMTLKLIIFVFILIGISYDSEMDTLFGTSFFSHFVLLYEQHKITVTWFIQWLISDLQTANIIADFFIPFLDCLFYFYLIFLSNILINAISSNSESMLSSFRKSFSKLKTLTHLWFRN